MTLKNDQLLTKEFILLSFSSLLFFSSFNMIIPELPNYLTSLGGAEYKGYIISLFTLTAAFSRPFSGKLTDSIGRVPIMIFGASVAFIVGISYPLFTSVAGFLFLRLIHGFSTGFKPTGTSAYIADIVPENRRGEAMGILGVATSLGMALGPTIGTKVASTFGYDILFYSSGSIALLSIIILFNLKETLDNKKRKPFSFKLLKISKDDFFEPRVIAPAIVFLFSTFSFGLILTIIPDLSESIGINDKGIYFTIFVLSSILIRFIAGKASDLHGRIPVIVASMVLLIVSMLLLTFVQTPTTFYLSAFVYGISLGMSSPTVFAWTADLANPKQIGRAFATIYIALEVGIGIGAFVSAKIYANNPEFFGFTFASGAITALFALIYSYSKFKTKHRNSRL
ncbi:MAG: MFS transporter [Bacteroidota bacterium]